MNKIKRAACPECGRWGGAHKSSCSGNPTKEFNPKSHLSNRGSDWIEFSDNVLVHIENYTIPQYGDKGQDQVSQEFSPEDCITNIKRYCNRHGKNSRPGQDKLDLLKIAHYAQMLYDMLDKE